MKFKNQILISLVLLAIFISILCIYWRVMIRKQFFIDEPLSTVVASKYITTV
jgi:hypothetical protein